MTQEPKLSKRLAACMVKILPVGSLLSLYPERCHPLFFTARQRRDDVVTRFGSKHPLRRL
jgi:hypothetical protein